MLRPTHHPGGVCLVGSGTKSSRSAPDLPVLPPSFPPSLPASTGT
jgi:hypothetical protein